MVKILTVSNKLSLIVTVFEIIEADKNLSTIFGNIFYGDGKPKYKFESLNALIVTNVEKNLYGIAALEPI